MPATSSGTLEKRDDISKYLVKTRSFFAVQGHPAAYGRSETDWSFDEFRDAGDWNVDRRELGDKSKNDPNTGARNQRRQVQIDVSVMTVAVKTGTPTSRIPSRWS